MPRRGQTSSFRGERRSAVAGKGLTERDIRVIRLDPRKLRDIARDHDISQPMVHHIKHRRRWAHVRD